MSLLDQEAFISHIHPFELLTPGQLRQVVDAADIAYYTKGTPLISPQEPATLLYIIVKGAVHEYRGEELIAAYHSMDSFDANALIYSTSESTFVVEQELICYELPKALFLELVAQNSRFAGYFLEDVTTKIQELKQFEQSSEFASFMVARVHETFLHEATIVTPETTLFEALRLKEEHNSSAILVTQTSQLGILTDTNLRRHLLSGGTLEQRVGAIATYPVIAIEHDDFLFNALLLLTRHTIKRLVVMKAGNVVGILEQLDLLSFFSNHSQLMVVQIEKAQNIESLRKISVDLINLIRALYAKGVKVRYITKLVSELNIKIYRKLLGFILPAHLLESAVLVVMGSEGRHEQILKTDQDNALIIDDAANIEAYTPYMQEFTQTLIAFGFPECPGNIMVSNPYWCKHESSYRREISRWIEEPDESSLMQMAIFYDATVVSGNAALFKRLLVHLFSELASQSHLLPHFAKGVLAFETPIGLFSNFILQKEHKNELDIKKGGIFPIVHGVRSFALQQQISSTNTVERIKVLNDKGVFSREFASELIEAYDTLLNLRLRTRLKKMAAQEELDNFIDPEQLSKIERDMLKESFKIVNRLKKQLMFHFHLENVT